MNKIENIATLDDIREIVQQIVERFRPQKVILFGSYAQGKPTKDSDVDLLVIMETNEQRFTRRPEFLRLLIIHFHWTSWYSDLLI
jgi:predicted nucleotidyltransferase